MCSQTLKGPACASFAWPFLQAPALLARWSIWPSLAHLNHPWLQRVRKADAEDYFDIITKPMDFAAMTKKLKKNEYFSKATTGCSRAVAECWCRRMRSPRIWTSSCSTVANIMQIQRIHFGGDRDPLTSMTILTRVVCSGNMPTSWKRSPRSCCR